MSEQVTEEPQVDYNRLICAIVESVGGSVLVTNEAYLNAKAARIVDVENGYLFVTTNEDGEELE